MKAYQSSNVMAQTWAGNSFLRKLFVSALMLALFVTAFPARAVLAAPSGDGKTFNRNEMQQEWDSKIQKVEYNSTFYQRVRVYPSNFKDPTELTTAHDLLNNYGVALRNAQRIIINHTGFDPKGKVVNDNQANQSLKDLSENLRLMRVYKENLDGLQGKYILLPMGAITTTTPK